MADEVIYNDPEPNNFPNDYDKSQVDSRTALRSESVKHKMKGHDVREALAQAVEINSVVATGANKKSDDAEKLSKDTQKRFDAQINGQNKDNEAKDARVSSADGKTYNILKDRLDAMDKKPQQAVDDLEVDTINLFSTNKWMGSGKYQDPFNGGIYDLPLDNIEPNTYYTVSTDLPSKSGDNVFVMTSKDENPSTSLNGVNSNKTRTVKTDSSATLIVGIRVRAGSPYNGTAKVMVQRGQKATSWTPAPEDSHHHQAFRKGTRFFAHRGAQSIAPENSLPAIRKAGNHAGVEIDIHQTSDGRWVIMHDGTVNRTTDGSGAVSSFTFAELRKLKLKDPVDSRTNPFSDSELVVPSLEEALVECKNQQLVPVIEIKVDGSDNYTSDSYNDLANIIKNYGLEDEIMFISFDYKALQSIKQRLPLVEVSYLVHTIDNDLMAQAQQLGVNSGLDSNYTAAGVTAANVAKCHSMGLKVGVWTTSDDSQRSKLINMGVDFITTNSLSGERRWAHLSYRGSFKDYVDNTDNYRSEVQEIAPGVINLQFILQTTTASSEPIEKGKPFATLPAWAKPNHRIWNQCMLRTSSSFTPATFDIDGESLNVGFDWDKKSTNGWVCGNVVYHV